MSQQNTGNYKGYFSLIIFFLLVGCLGEKKPAAILTEEEMVRVMREIYIDEEKIVRMNLNRDSSEKIFKMAQPYIFKRAGVSDSVFRQSYAYYSKRPKTLERIYTALVDSLSLQEQKLTNATPGPVK